MKYLIYFKKNRKLYLFLGMLFTLFLGLLILSTIFSYYSNYVNNIKKDVPYTLINIYDAKDEEIEKIIYEEYVEKVVSSNYFIISVDDESFYVYSDLLLDQEKLTKDEMIINERFSKLLDLDVGDRYIYEDKEFTIVDIVSSNDNFNSLYVNINTISNYTYYDSSNYFVVLDNYDSYSKLVSDYPDLNLSFYSAPLEEKLIKYNTILKMFNYLEVVIIFFVFIILILILNNIINEEKKDIAIYRTVGFSIFRLTGIYILKLFMIDIVIFMLSLIVLEVVLLIFNLGLIFSIRVINYFVISLICCTFVAIIKLQRVKKEKIVTLLKNYS